jgi:hypothetical protein
MLIGVQISNGYMQFLFLKHFSLPVYKMKANLLPRIGYPALMLEDQLHLVTLLSGTFQINSFWQKYQSTVTKNMQLEFQ